MSVSKLIIHSKTFNLVLSGKSILQFCTCTAENSKWKFIFRWTMRAWAFEIARFQFISTLEITALRLHNDDGRNYLLFLEQKPDRSQLCSEMSDSVELRIGRGGRDKKRWWCAIQNEFIMMASWGERERELITALRLTRTERKPSVTEIIIVAFILL